MEFLWFVRAFLGFFEGVVWFGFFYVLTQILNLNGVNCEQSLGTIHHYNMSIFFFYNFTRWLLHKQLVTESEYFISASHPVTGSEVYLCYLPSCSATSITLMYIFQCQYRTLMYRYSL